jgi:hypothetical protein
MGDWTFFSNYGHVLVCLARDNRARLRDVAREVGITERAVQKIVKDMQTEGFIEVRKQGRCNRYRINRRKVLRHPLVSHCTVGKLLALIAERGQSAELIRPTEPVAPVKAATTPQAPAPGIPDEPAPKPESKPEPAPQPKPAVEAEKKRKSRPKPKPEPGSKPKSDKGAVDPEQQGSLF